jgi:hypothetical protein
VNRDWWASEWNRTEYDQDRYDQVVGHLKDLLGGTCAQCGSAEDLEFDHIDPTTKDFSITKMWNRGPEVLLPELKKCQLLCKEHHIAKTMAVRRVPHGGGVSGRGGCHCDPCRLKRNEYARDRKRRKRQQIKLNMSL